jgi:hypothetical protein
LHKHARLAWDNSGREIFEGLNVQLFVEELVRRDSIVVNPDDYVLPVRMCMMLWGLAYHLNYRHRVCESAKSSNARRESFLRIEKGRPGVFAAVSN